nr:nephrin-like [Procambarus clarkii]
MEDVWGLVVHYVPRAVCAFGANLDSGNIKEGDDVYFECSIQANPAVSRVSWRHHERALVHNVSEGVIVSNQSLVLQRVTRTQAGRYACLAHNAVGAGLSNTLTLDVKYAPVCSPGQVTSYAVERYEDAEVTCSVEANPIQESFQWTFNNTADTIDVPHGRFSTLASHSVITYTPMTAFDYGTLLCWATNEIGDQKEPCVFHIVPAGKPEPPGNCTLGARTRTSVRVQCVAGSSGGLPQHFLLQARSQAPQHHHQLNFTSTSPEFYVEGLQVEGKYQLLMRAVNDKGSSSATQLTVASSGTNNSVYQLHDGPLEAEVRDGGQTGVGSDGGAAGTNHTASLFPSLALPSLFMGALGTGSGLVFVVIVSLLCVAYHKRRVSHQPGPLADPLHHTEARDTPRGASKCTLTSPTLTPEHHITCLERDMQVSLLWPH